MTGCAGHLPLAQRVVRGFQRRGMLDLVAFGADFRLRRGAPNRVLSLVHLVAIGAGDITRRVRAGAPGMGSVRLMASEAHGILLRRRSMRAGAEVDDAGRLPALGFDMRIARPVAGLTLQPAMSEGTAGIIRLCVASAEKA
jgi:hypothetical protein